MASTKTNTQLLNAYLSLTKDTTTSNSTDGQSRINDSVKAICNLQGGKLRFLEDTVSLFTVAGQERYQIPNKFRKLIDVMIYSDNGADGANRSTIYSPEMVFDPTKWKLVLQYRYGTQDVPYFTYVERSELLVQPIPATTGNLMVLRGRLQTSNMSIADYSTGSIVSVAQNGTAVVGSGTTWTADMVGRVIQIAQTNAANGGDGFWYEIGTWTNATNITLTKPYEGRSIAAATATYIIGQAPVVPEAYESAILYRAVAQYWQENNDLQRARMYWIMYDGGNELGENKEYGGLIGQMLDNEGETEEGAYIPPFGSSQNLPQNPYYFPNQNASGFAP